MWIILSCIKIVSFSGVLTISKRLSRDIHAAQLVYLQSAVCVLFSFLLFFVLPFEKRTSWQFFMFAGSAGVLNIIAQLLQAKAFRLSDLSLLAPLAAIHPLLVLLLSIIFLKEIPSVTNAIGIVYISFGLIVHGLAGSQTHIISSVKRMLKTPSVFYILLAMMLWSITPIFEKKALQVTMNPLLLSIISMSIVGSSTGLILFVKKETKTLLKPKKIVLLLIGYGFLSVLGQISVFTAFSMTNVAYVSALIKLNIVVTLFFSSVFLKEKVPRHRYIAGLIMIIGALLLML
jgi:bacterial/archaeal transporter family protein